MFFRKLKNLIILNAIFFYHLGYANEVAITFDDLPGQQDLSAQKLEPINNQIITTLRKFNAPAIGFVNEYKLYSKGQTKEKIAILKSWVDNGFSLGNHTFSHHSLTNSNLDEYEQDVLKGETISKKLMNEAGMDYHYFRYPYLDMGRPLQKRTAFEKFLKAQNLIIAPVTINTDDWKFNRSLNQNPKSKDEVIQKYLAYTRARFAFYEKVSKKLFNRNIKHVWLLHVNLLNSLVINDLLKIAQEYNYNFVTLDAALKDLAYLSTDTFYAATNQSWLYRWDLSKNKVINWSDEPVLDNNLAIIPNDIKFAIKDDIKTINKQTVAENQTPD